MVSIHFSHSINSSMVGVLGGVVVVVDAVDVVPNTSVSLAREDGLVVTEVVVVSLDNSGGGVVVVVGVVVSFCGGEDN